MLAERWEHGSDFHLPGPGDLRGFGEGGQHPWNGSAVFYGTGRDALLHLVATEGWKRLWIPSYFCGDVLESLRSGLAATGCAILSYPCKPDERSSCWTRASFEKGDALLVVNLLGLQEPPPAYPRGIPVIEDHTHDPWSDWSFHSKADFCLASLRKTLPLPDGGVLWSPKGRTLPKPLDPTPEHLRVFEAKLAAMALKASYLNGADVDKQQFRNLAVRAENRINGQSHFSGIAWLSRLMLERFPVQGWRTVRRANQQFVHDALVELRGVQVLMPQASNGCAIGSILLFESEQTRNRVRSALIRQRIYPAILWEQPKSATAEYDFSSRMLSIHTDYRYDKNDMERVVQVLLQEGRER